MEFLKREDDSWHSDHPKNILPKREYAKEDNDKFFRDVEDMADAQDARRYKEEARSAMDVAMYRKTADFDETFERWQENKDKLQALREGLIKPSEPEFQPDWHKIGTTAVWQTTSLSFALLCIISGVWPICLVSLPLMAGMNLKWLLDREGK